MAIMNTGSTGLDAQHIASNLASYEAARSGFFSLIVDGLDNLVRADYSSADRTNPVDSDIITNAQDYLALNVTSFNPPHFQLDTLKYTRGNEVVKFAGVPSFGDGSLKVDDVVGLDTKSILMAWQALAYDIKTRRGGRMKDYKKNCTLLEYTQDYELVRTWHLEGCWISSIEEEAFNKESDGKRQLSATIQYDRAWMEMPKTETEAQNLL